MTYRLSALLVVSGCIFSLLSGCSFLPQHESGDPKTSDLIAPTNPVQPAASVKPLKCELPIPDNRTLDAAVARASGTRHRSFQVQLDRACNYVKPAKKIFREKGLPPDLVYVALVESGFTPRARSRAKAVGMWQIISGTGARFGLQENHWIDERCDPMKAAQAAADYLSHLYNAFGDWPLAIAGYNAGQRAVRDALHKSGLKTFWELADAGWLPAETRNYVPKVYAAVIIARNPDRYGFWYKPDHYIARYEKVSVPGGVKLAWVGKQIGVSKNELLNCNPELCKPVTPPCCSQYDLCVPVGCRDSVLSALANHSPCEARTEPEFKEFKKKFEPGRGTLTLAAHKVSHKDTWSSPARRYKSPIDTPGAMNDTRIARLLKLKQSLKVRASSAHVRIAVAGSRGHTAAMVPSGGKNRETFARKINEKPGKAAALKTIHYRVSHGDTLWTVSARFHVPVRTLCAQNDLRLNQKIMPGAHLAIHADRPGSSRLAKRK